jgi:hypothetical protein
MLIGAAPRTEWLREVINLDDHGFVRTGRDLASDAWPLSRPPLPFETSVPGVFAAGNVRNGSVKRVAGAVGEGSVAVGSVHRYLAELPVSANVPVAHRTLRTLTFVMLNRCPSWLLSPSITEAVGAAMRRVPPVCPQRQRR